LQFYILTSNNYPALKRHFDYRYSNLEVKDAVVVINTLMVEHTKLVKSFCESKGIEYHITECDGTPATGKNSVLDIFLASDNDYCVLVDGDDLLTTHGVWFYKNLETIDNPPDALLLLNQKSIRFAEDVTHVNQPFTVDYDALLRFDYVAHFKEKYLLDDETAEFYQDLHSQYYGQSKKYSQDSEAHSRVTWISKKAAQFRFDADIVVGEDTLNMFELKHQAKIGSLDVKTTDENPATYLYDQTYAGIVATVSNGYSDYHWMQRYLMKLDEMEEAGKLHEDFKLSALTIDYPEDYALGDYGITR
jgi:hypothetical protein